MALFFILVTFVSVAGLGANYAHALSWSQVNSDGFGEAQLVDVRLVSFNGSIFTSTVGPGGSFVYRYDGATSWTKVSADGFGDANNGFSILTTYNSKLYALVDNNLGAQIWETSNGTNWSQVASGGLGDANNTTIDSVVQFNDTLYLGTGNSISGGQVITLDANNNLTVINATGFADANNISITSLDVFNDSLYAGTDNITTMSQIWRSDNGTSWTQVQGNGFGADNTTVMSLFHMGGFIYATTYNGVVGTQIWRSSNGTDWLQTNTSGFGTVANLTTSPVVPVVNGTAYVGTLKVAGGAELYTSSDGTTWTQEGTDGFGDANNLGIFAITFDGSIYVGFSNLVTGAEIWKSEGLIGLSFGPDTLPDGHIGQEYQNMLEPLLGTAPYTFSLEGDLPPGLNLTEDGFISGTPTQKGSYTFTITLIDSGNPQQTVSRSMSINIDIDVLPQTGATSSPRSVTPIIILSLIGVFTLSTVICKLARS